MGLISLGEVDTRMEGKPSCRMCFSYVAQRLSLQTGIDCKQNLSFPVHPKHQESQQFLQPSSCFSVLWLPQEEYSGFSTDHSWMTRSAISCCSKVEAEIHSEGELILQCSELSTAGETSFSCHCRCLLCHSPFTATESVSTLSKAQLKPLAQFPMKIAPSQPEVELPLPSAGNAPSEEAVGS